MYGHAACGSHDVRIQPPLSTVQYSYIISYVRDVYQVISRNQARPSRFSVCNIEKLGHGPGDQITVLPTQILIYPIKFHEYPKLIHKNPKVIIIHSLAVTYSY